MANSDWVSPSLSDDNATENNDTADDDDTGVSVNATSNCSSLPSPWSAWSTHYHLVTATFCSLYLLFGLVCAFFGYRCFKAVMFFTGFIFASVVVYLICLEERHVLPLWSSVLVAVSAGVLFGLITLLVQYVGIFMLGFHAGLLIAIVGLCAVDLWPTAARAADLGPKVAGWATIVQPGSPWVTLAVMLMAGMAMALLNLRWQKSLSIFSSALYGGSVLCATLDYFLENSAMLFWVWDKVRVRDSPAPPCWFSWLLLAFWPATVVIGIMTQCICTGKGIYHDQQFPPLNSRTNNSRGKPETREERKQRKYRYLYQVRTCHGDVISQPIPGKYVQQVNESYSA